MPFCILSMLFFSYIGSFWDLFYANITNLYLEVSTGDHSWKHTQTGTRKMTKKKKKSTMETCLHETNQCHATQLSSRWLAEEWVRRKTRWIVHTVSVLLRFTLTQFPGDAACMRGQQTHLLFPWTTPPCHVVKAMFEHTCVLVNVYFILQSFRRFLPFVKPPRFPLQ